MAADLSRIPVDDSSAFGAHRPPAFVAAVIFVTQRLKLNWLGRRLTYLLRQLALLGMGDCADVSVFGARLRLYPHQNVSEKRVLFATGLFDPAERDALKALAAPGAVFVDVGANVGLYSLSVGEAFAAHKDARIVAVEPHPVIYRRLAFNAALNPAFPITPVEAGIADHEGTLPLTLHGDNLGETRMVQGGMVRDADRSVEVPVMTLMQLMTAQGLTHIDGLKVDVEGFEEKVLLPFLDAAADAQLPRVMIVENNVKQWQADISDIAVRRGYATHRISKNNLLLTRDAS